MRDAASRLSRDIRTLTEGWQALAAVIPGLRWAHRGMTDIKIPSHGQFAVTHRRPGGEAFGRIDDGVRIDAVMAIEDVDRAGLAEMLDAERFHPMAAHAAEPGQRRRMAVDHGHEPAIARQR